MTPIRKDSCASTEPEFSKLISPKLTLLVLTDSAQPFKSINGIKIRGILNIFLEYSAK